MIFGRDGGRFAVAGIALLLALPLSMGWHPPPTLGTLAEVVAVGCAAFALLVSPLRRFPPARQYFLGIGGLLLLLLARALLQPLFSESAYAAFWLGPAAAFAVAALVSYAWQGGAWLRVVAAAVLLAAVVNAGIGFLQFWRFHDLLGFFEPYWVFVDRADPIPVGNVAQKNVLASLCLIGIAASVYLDWARRPVMIGIEVFLAYVAALTSSRTPWLIVAAVVVISVMHLGFTGVVKQTSLRRFVLPVLVALLAAPLLNGWISAMVGLELPADSLDRLEAVGVGLRPLYFSMAFDMTLQHPWSGIGWKATPLAMLEEGYRRHEWGVDEIPTHVHNLFFQLALENGLLIALAVTGYLAWRAIAPRVRSADADFAWLSFMVLFVHSLVEYPLWHPGFLLLFCIAVRTLEAAHTVAYAAPVADAPMLLRRGVLKCASLVVVLAAALTAAQFAALARTWQFVERSVQEPGLRARVQQLSANPLVEPYGNWAEANLAQVPPLYRVRLLERVAAWTPDDGVLRVLQDAYLRNGMWQQAAGIEDRRRVVFGVGGLAPAGATGGEASPAPRGR
jgi:hypothetical protein